MTTLELFEDLNGLWPHIFLACAAMILTLAGAFHNDGAKAFRVVSWGAGISLALTTMLLLGSNWSRNLLLGDMLRVDMFSATMCLLILLGLIISVALSIKHLETEKFARFEYPVLILFAGLGMMLMVSANSLLSLYMALELQSLSLYVLAAIRRNTVRAAEAGLKYFVLGALSSGMILFGSSIIYGFTGSLNFDQIAASFSVNDPLLQTGALTGMIFLLCGLAFKLSAVPFHMWTPDVYEGAPTPVTALFALVPKLAAFGLLCRVLYVAFLPAMDTWLPIIWFLAMASMTLGAFAALRQENIKRLLAYGSIGNVGFALVGLAAGTSAGIESTLIYMTIYMITTAGAFSVVLMMRQNGRMSFDIDSLAGLARVRPLVAFGFLAILLSMAGIPPFAGFFAKFYVFRAAIESELYILAVAGILTSVVAAFYYLRIIKVMFFDEVMTPLDNTSSFARRIILFLSVLFISIFIFVPEGLTWMLSQAAAVFPLK